MIGRNNTYFAILFLIFQILSVEFILPPLVLGGDDSSIAVGSIAVIVIGIDCLIILGWRGVQKLNLGSDASSLDTLMAFTYVVFFVLGLLNYMVCSYTQGTEIYAAMMGCAVIFILLSLFGLVMSFHFILSDDGDQETQNGASDDE